MAGERDAVNNVLAKEFYKLMSVLADVAREGLSGVGKFVSGGVRGIGDGISSLFSGGLKDAAAAKMGAAAVAGGVAVAAAAGTALGGAKTAAETAVGQVAGMAVDAAGATRDFVANAATVTTSIAAGAEPAPSGERTVSVAEFLAVPAKGGGATGVATDVSPKSDFNYAAPGAPLPALEATIGAGGGKFDPETYERARAQIAGIKPSGMG